MRSTDDVSRELADMVSQAGASGTLTLSVKTLKRIKEEYDALASTCRVLERVNNRNMTKIL